MPDEYRLIWTTPGGGGQTTLYTQPTGTAQAVTNSIRSWLVSLCAGLSNQVTVTMGSEVRRLNVGTGQLEQVFGVTPGTPVPGNVASQPVADSSQVLMRWNTGHIVGGRRLVGRTFIPGLPVGSLTAGNLSGASAADFATKGQNLITTLSGSAPLVVWHRPKAGAGGEAWAADVATCWTEMAVLRRRRG